MGETERPIDPGSTGDIETSGAPSTTDGTATGGQDDADSGLDDGPSDDTGDDGCQSSDECQSPGETVCDIETGECVGCTADEDGCGLGTYCDSDQKTCVEGCIEDANCGGDLICDVENNQCTGCVEDGDCPPGTVCGAGGACEPGCTNMHPCQPGLACCSGDCVDIDTDLDHCGGCNNPCDPPNAQGICDAGTCDIDDCDQGFNDCNQNITDGCEVQGSCACDPGEVQACYTGPAGTEGVGECQAGTQECNATGTGWGPCMGQILPSPEVCDSGMDENCNGEIDENPDNDGDGWGVCDGDCCDSVGPNCLNPALVNPGAFEYPGNGVDDDCDGVIDNALPSCDANLASNSADALDYARAINLCSFTTENPPLPNRIWGVISAQLLRADGSANPSPNSRSLRNGFGNVITNREGSRLAVLSTGRAAAEGEQNPSFDPFQDGVDTTVQSGVPADWYQANNNALPNAPGCPSPINNVAYDPMMLRVRVRVPTNAQSFSVDVYFFSSEYPEYICSQYNDFFVTLVDSGANNPADKNIAVYTDANNVNWPLGVNILKAAPGLFTQCENGGIQHWSQHWFWGWGCHGPVDQYNGCLNTDELSGTGMDRAYSTPLSCGFSGMHGGGTSWLTMHGNVTPGETMEIRFAIWDTSDQWLDSVVLLDNWQWDVDPSAPGIIPQ